MKKSFLIALMVGLFVFISGQAMALTLTENFEEPFPAWESGWLGTNSNIQNVYGIGGGRGNNPDGLWIADGLDNGALVKITFNSTFGASITGFSIDTTTWLSGAMFEAFDMNGNSLLSTEISVMNGAYTDPGVYQTIAFSSLAGVSGFSIIGGQVEGNTSIDNVVVITDEIPPVPEPSTILLMGAGLLGLVGYSRKRSKK